MTGTCWSASYFELPLSRILVTEGTGRSETSSTSMCDL